MADGGKAGIGRGARQIMATEVRGAPHDRGRQMGEQLRPVIHAHIWAWLGSLESAGLGEPRQYVAEMLRATDFKSAIGAHAPDLLEEMEGIAAGAGAEPELIYAQQLMDEEWFFRRRRAAEAKLEKCSSVAMVAPDGPTLIGQNMDLGAYTDGFQALLRIEAHGDAPGALVFTTAGMIGLMGVNEAAIGVCVNSLPQLPNAPQGMPVAFVIRRLLQAPTLAEAANLVQRLPHATNQHYLIASPEGVRSFEASAAEVTEYRPADASRILHTNHPLAEVQGEAESAAERENTVARLRSLTDRLARSQPTIEDVKAALSSCDDPRHPVCRIPDGEAGLTGFTTGSMVSALGKDRIESSVSPGPPSERGYTRFRLDAS